jgi:hypothetical protein
MEMTQAQKMTTLCGLGGGAVIKGDLLSHQPSQGQISNVNRDER